MSEDKDVCFMCETNEATHVTASNNDPICDDCIFSCDECGDIGTENDNWYSVDHYRWCEGCADNAYYCDRCEEYSSDCGYYIQDIGTNWCDSCASYYAEWCDECEHYTSDPCDNCDGDTQGGVRVVHDYNYRPDPIFHTISNNERLFFGVELEMEVGDERADAALYAYNALESIDLAYLKNDGSLEDGFELVTHPMSFDFLMDNDSSVELWDTIENLRVKYDARSYHTRTCGFHIHISRTGFKGGAHMHRFLNLVYSNPTFYSKLAGRKSDQWAKFDDVYRHHYDPITDKHSVVKAMKDKLHHDRMFGNDSDRYSAVNTRNSQTLEMRIFKGTLDRNALKAHIQLAHASVEYTRDLSVNDVKDGALSATKFAEYIADNYDKYPELLERMHRKQVLMPSDENSIRYSSPDNYNYDMQSRRWYQAERERRFEEERARVERERAERRDNPTEEERIYGESMADFINRITSDVYRSYTVSATDATLIERENN